MSTSVDIKARVRRGLEIFPLLPNEALIEIRVVSALIGRSTGSIWRDVASGCFPTPVKVGGSTRWRAGDIRAVLSGAV